jgi:DNA repair protein RecN (Recombination protein N)
LKSLAFEAYAALNGEDDSEGSALLNLNSALKALRRLCSIDAALLPQTESLAAAVSNVEEAAREIFSYKEKLHYDPDEMDEIEGRLELLRSLKKKYGAGISQIRDTWHSREKELESLSALEQEKLKKDRGNTGIEANPGKKPPGELSRNAAVGPLPPVRRGPEGTGRFEYVPGCFSR